MEQEGGRHTGAGPPSRARSADDWLPPVVLRGVGTAEPHQRPADQAGFVACGQGRVLSMSAVSSR